MKKGLLAILLVVVSAGAWAQPRWTYKTLPTPKNYTYRFERTVGTGATMNDARTQAIAQVFQQTSNRLGQPVNAAEINRAVQRGDNFDVLSSTFNIKIINVDYYAEQQPDGSWHYHLLCEVAESANIEPQFTTFHGNDDAIATLQSAFIPGLGQINKGKKLPGAMILTGEIALVGAGTFCYLTAQNKLDVMHSDDVNYADYSKARDDYNRLRDASYVIWGAAAGLYVFNLISAYYMELPRIKHNKKYAFTPVILQDENRPMAGLTVRVKF